MIKHFLFLSLITAYNIYAAEGRTSPINKRPCPDFSAISTELKELLIAGVADHDKKVSLNREIVMNLDHDYDIQIHKNALEYERLRYDSLKKLSLEEVLNLFKSMRVSKSISIFNKVVWGPARVDIDYTYSIDENEAPQAFKQFEELQKK